MLLNPWHESESLGIYKGIYRGVFIQKKFKFGRLGRPYGALELLFGPNGGRSWVRLLMFEHAACYQELSIPAYQITKNQRLGVTPLLGSAPVSRTFPFRYLGFSALGSLVCGSVPVGITRTPRYPPWNHLFGFHAHWDSRAVGRRYGRENENVYCQNFQKVDRISPGRRHTIG